MDSKKIDLASLFNEVAKQIAKEDSREIKETLIKIENASKAGKTNLKVEIDGDVYKWLTYYSIVDKKDSIKPDYLVSLDNYGFTYSNPDFGTKFLGIKYTMVISWAK